MSYLVAPQLVTGVLIDLKNPGNNQNSAPPDRIQIRNASGYVITVQSGGQNKLIDPFTAATIPANNGLDCLINPSFNAYTNFTTGYLSAEWLLPNEDASEPDGPLTSAATIATLSSSAIQLQNFTIGNPINIPIGASGPTTVNIPANVHSIRFWFKFATLADTANMTIVGVQTGMTYANGPVPVSDGQILGVFSNIDTQLNISFTGATSAATLWIEGSSDPSDISVDLLNTAIGVNNGTSNNGHLTVAQAIPTTESGNSVIVNNSGALVTGAPAAGFIRRITELSFSNAPSTTGTLAVYHGSSVGGILIAEFDITGGGAANQPQPVNWITQNGLFVNWPVTSAFRVTASFHDEYFA